MSDQPNIDKNYQGSRRIFSLLPARSRETFDKALLGRMAKKNLLFKDEKDVARKVKYRGEETYPLARAATNPIIAGVAGGAFAHTWGKYKYPALKQVYEKYEALSKKKDPIAAQLRKAMASKVLKNPKTGTMYKSLEELKAVTQKTPKQLRNKAILMGLATAGVTALGRILHPRALKGEALHSATEYKHRDPSEYIRTKLRDDVQLRKISHTIKAQVILEKQAGALSIANKAVSLGMKEVRPAAAFQRISRTASGFQGGAALNVSSRVSKAPMSPALTVPRDTGLRNVHTPRLQVSITKTTQG
jgi:hypothetical protein